MCVGSDFYYLICSRRVTGIHEYCTRMAMQAASRKGTYMFGGLE